MNNENGKKVVIIGGGVAGLAAGVYALLSGYEAEIYEKNAIPGGECIGWNRKGYHIDNCIHWLTGTKKGTSLYEVWEKVGALSDDTKYAKIDAFYAATYDGKTATLWNDLEKTKRELIELAPEDKDEIEKFITHVEYSKQCLFPAEKPMDMMGVLDYIKMGASMKDMPKVMKEYGKISLEEYSMRFKNPLLQRLMRDYLPKEYTAYSFLVSYATMADGNGMIPIGASLQMSLRMEKRFKELGGKIFYNMPAESIVLDGKIATGVKFADKTVEADYIIPTVDTNVLFNRLLPNSYMPKELALAYKDENAYPVTSGFQVAYAVDVNFDNGETVFADIKPLKIGERVFDRMYVKSYGYDDIFVKDGKMVIQTCISQTDVDYYFWKGLSEEDYKRVKSELTDAVTERILEVYPELKDSIELLDTWTPLTYERYCGAYHGGYMSFVTTPNAKQIRLKGTLDGIDNIYLAGQWTNSPGGLPVAVASGKFAIQRILKKAKLSIKI